MIASLAYAVLPGCCALGPCDPIAGVAGRITAVSGAPIQGATVEIDSMRTKTDENGCFRSFKIGVPPLKFTVTSPGLKPISSNSTSSTSQALVVLVPLEGLGESSVKWLKSKSASLDDVPGCT